MTMKILIAMTAVLAMASSATATWMYENFESYNSKEEAFAVWIQVSEYDLGFWLTGGWDGPKIVRGAKTARRHVRDLVPDIQAAPGGACMTAFNGTDSQSLVVEVAFHLKGDTLEFARSQGFYWDLVKADGSIGRGLAFGAYPTYGGTSSREGLMYYDGLNWTELETLKHALGWNFIRAIIKETTVSFMYWDENMSNGMQTATVNREYLGAYDAMGINSTKCIAKVDAADAFKLSDGVFVPEPATVLLLGLGGLSVMRRRTASRKSGFLSGGQGRF